VGVTHHATVIGFETTIRILTCSALVGLLGAIGLRLTYREIKWALLQCRFLLILLVNFLVIPLVTVLMATWFGLKRDVAIAMILLAAAPFAPVVPVFARMANAELALAAGLTAVFPLACAVLTPIVAQVSLRAFETDHLHFDMLASVVILLITISLPLIAGLLIRHRAPGLGQRLLRPVEAISEALGAVSLAFVTATKFRSTVDLGWRAWLAMVLVSEISLLLGWKTGGPGHGARRVVALGTSNRNIALALLVAIQSFPGTDVAPSVVGNGLLLIALGLLHVAWWRFVRTKRCAA
jgi:bile acid:Na+ symporter, BASS family